MCSTILITWTTKDRKKCQNTWSTSGNCSSGESMLFLGNATRPAVNLAQFGSQAAKSQGSSS